MIPTTLLLRLRKLYENKNLNQFERKIIHDAINAIGGSLKDTRDDLWTIKVIGARGWRDAYSQVAPEGYISSNCRVVGKHKAVALESLELAEKFKDVLKERKKYANGESTLLFVEKYSGWNGPDDILVKARIDQNILSPSKLPLSR